MYEPLKMLSTLNHLINCLYDHKYPSMTHFRNEFIVVVGGMERNLKSEIYSKTKRKWKTLPDLPEPRYGAGLMGDEKSNYLYLFGGLCDQNFCSSILKLNMKSLVIWESVIVKENSHLLQRSHFALMKLDNFRILILGGSKKDNEYCDSVVEFDLLTKGAYTTEVKLLKPGKFSVSNYVELGNQLYYFFDTQNFIHIFNKETLTFRCSDFKEGNEEYIDAETQ